MRNFLQYFSCLLFFDIAVARQVRLLSGSAVSEVVINSCQVDNRLLGSSRKEEDQRQWLEMAEEAPVAL